MEPCLCKLTSAGVPTKAPTTPAAMPRPAFTKKLGGSPWGLKFREALKVSKYIMYSAENKCKHLCYFLP